jgi:hypothetical protein
MLPIQMTNMIHMMNRFFDLDDLKKNICLPELMKDNGYEPVRAKSSRSHLFMQSVDKSLVIYKNKKGHWVYFDVHTNIRQFDPAHPEASIAQTTTGLTVLDFIMMEFPRTDLRHAIQIAVKYKETGEFLSTGNPAFRLNERRSFQPDSLFNITQRQFKPLGEFSRYYFKARAIAPEIVRHPIFNGIFYEWPVSYDGMANSNENSVGTKMMLEDGKITCLLSSKIGRKTFSFGRKSESLWYTSPEICRQRMDCLFTAESWQDAVAHYEMNINQLEGKNILYTSCQGNMSPQQMLFIDRIVKERQPVAVTTLYDNDPNGVKYTCNLLNKIFENNPFDVELSTTKKEVTGFITSDMDKHDFIQTMSRNFGNTAEMKISRTFEGKNQAVLTFAVDRQDVSIMSTLRQFVEGVYRIKNIPGHFQTEYSLAKDFNDDLKNLKIKDQKKQISIN